MSLSLSEILNNAIGGFIAAAAFAGWLAFTPRGKAFWQDLGAVKGLRPVAIMAAFGVVLALFALFTILLNSKASSNEMKLELFAGTPSGRGTKLADGNVEASASAASCPDGSILINALCSTDKQQSATGALRASGLQHDGSFPCVWSGVDRPDSLEGQVQPICLRISKK